MVYKRLKDWQFWLLAKHCLLCQQGTARDQAICDYCHQSLPFLGHHCRQCGNALATTTMSVCGDCLRQAPYFSRTEALFAYQSPIDGLVQQLKYHSALYLAQVLGTLMADYLLKKQPIRPDLLLPIPLHRQRLRQRGFNQALEIARPIAQALKLPIDPRIVVRHRSTLPQAEVDAKKRYGNVRGAFRLEKPVKALKIALIDDVMTTGHTANAVARVLHRGGAADVQIWVVTRSQKYR